MCWGFFPLQVPSIGYVHLYIIITYVTYGVLKQFVNHVPVLCACHCHIDDSARPLQLL